VDKNDCPSHGLGGPRDRAHIKVRSVDDPVLFGMKYRVGFEKLLKPLSKDRDDAWPSICQHHRGSDF
jgi:hypothetical protein